MTIDFCRQQKNQMLVLILDTDSNARHLTRQINESDPLAQGSLNCGSSSLCFGASHTMLKEKEEEEENDPEQASSYGHLRHSHRGDTR